MSYDKVHNSVQFYTLSKKQITFGSILTSLTTMPLWKIQHSFTYLQFFVHRFWLKNKSKPSKHPPKTKNRSFILRGSLFCQVVVSLRLSAKWRASQSIRRNCHAFGRFLYWKSQFWQLRSLAERPLSISTWKSHEGLWSQFRLATHQARRKVWQWKRTTRRTLSAELMDNG